MTYLKQQTDHEHHSKTRYNICMILNKKLARENRGIFSPGPSFETHILLEFRTVYVCKPAGNQVQP